MGTYSKIYSKTTGALWRKGTNRYDSYPAGLVHLWNATSPTSRLVGPYPVYSAASQQPDANGDLVDWPNYVPGRGVEVHPAYSNIWPAGGLLTGTGVTEAGLTKAAVGDYIRCTVVTNTYSFIRITGTTTTTSRSTRLKVKIGNVNYISIRTLNLDGSTVKYITVNLVTAAIVNTSNSTVVTASITDGVVTINLTAVVVIGKNFVILQYSPSRNASPPDDTQAAFGVLAGDYVDIHQQIISTDRAFQLPYIPPGASVASTAATSAGNGLAIPLDARMTAALSGIFTAAALVNMQASSAEITADTNILAVNNNITGGIYMAASGILKAYDGTNTATVTVSGGWEREDEILIVWWINAAGTNQQIGYKKKAASTITWGSAASYDGSVNPGTHLRYGYTIDKPIGIIHSHLWNKSVVTDAEILALIDRYVN